VPEIGRRIVAWWVLELLVAALLIAIVLVLGPLIKRFGRTYAGDVFRANPRTGKSYLVLMDVAYYLIFGAYVLSTLTFAPQGSWKQTVSAGQLQSATTRIGGMLLLMGVLHGASVLTLPVVGRLLGFARDLEGETAPHAP
jgi:hypothetical protein